MPIQAHSHFQAKHTPPLGNLQDPGVVTRRADIWRTRHSQLCSVGPKAFHLLCSHAPLPATPISGTHFPLSQCSPLLTTSLPGESSSFPFSTSNNTCFTEEGQLGAMGGDAQGGSESKRHSLSGLWGCSEPLLRFCTSTLPGPVQGRRWQVSTWVSVVVFRTASQGSGLPVTGGIQAEGGQLPFRDAEEGISLIAGRWSR